MSNKPVVNISKLTRCFGTKKAIAELDLQIESGVSVGLVGPNGSGKTTLLHLILGLLEPTEGSVQVLEHDARRLPAEIQSAIACVGERNFPPRATSIHQLLALQNDAVKNFDRLYARDMLEEQGLKPWTIFGALSKGQRRWLLATLALASRPKLLIMDEPADGLDPASRRRLFNRVRDYVNQQQGTAIIASHILADLQRTSDELIILKQGQMRLHDSLETLRDEIRELEFPNQLEPPPLHPNLEIVARKTVKDTDHLWVRATSTEAQESLEKTDGLSAVRTVNLESLYYALTESEEHDHLANNSYQPEGSPQ